MMVSTVRRWPCAPSAAGAQASWASRIRRVLPTSLLPCPEHVERRVVHEPVGAHERARLDGEQSPEDRDAAHEADRAVDGIDDQPGACRPGVIPLFFPKNAQAGMTLVRERAGHRLDGLVHIGDWAVVGLLLDLEAGRPEAAQRELVGPVGDLVAQREPAPGAPARAGPPRRPAPAPGRAP